MIHLTPKQVNIIIIEVCDEFCITEDELISESKEGELAEARAIIFYIAVILNSYPMRSLSRRLKRGHSNVHSMSKRVFNEISINKDYKIKIDRIVKLVDIKLK